MHTAIHNNLKEHFVTRLLRFINKTTQVYDEDLDKVDARKARRELKDAVFLPRIMAQIFATLDSTRRGRRLRFSKV